MIFIHFTYIDQNPFTVTSYVLLYIIIGICYVWFKWSSFVRMAVRSINAILDKNKNYKMFDAVRFAGYRSVPLKVNDYKYKIISWMSY